MKAYKLLKNKLRYYIVPYCCQYLPATHNYIWFYLKRNAEKILKIANAAYNEGVRFQKMKGK